MVRAAAGTAGTNPAASKFYASDGSFPLALATHDAAGAGSTVTVAPTVRDPSPRPGQKRQADVIEMFSFFQEMGIDPVKESEMLWIAEEAFHAPLPPGWTEHIDELGRAYFHCAATGESAWQHPMDSLFREVVNYYRRIQEVGGFWTVEDELAELEEQIRRDLADWMELFDEHGEKFYYNRQTEESRFDDPRNAVYHSLYTRIRMVAKIREHQPLLARAPRPDDPTAREVELQQVQEAEESRFLGSVLRVQAFARALMARRVAKAKRAKRNLDRVPQPLRGRLRLRLEAVGQGGRDELVLAVTTPQRNRKAAAKIQARVRGLLARKRFQPRVNHRRFLDSAALVLQRSARRWLERRRARREAKARLHRAATVIQSVVRARKGRSFAGELRRQRDGWKHRSRCILRIQTAWRAFLAQRELKRRRHRDLTRRALVMQKKARAFLAQANLVRLGLVTQPVRFAFKSQPGKRARKLQPWTWSLAMAPVDDGSVCEGPGASCVDLFAAAGPKALQDIAATHLQRSFRGWHVRRTKREERIARLLAMEEQAKMDALRRKAIIRIQQRFRGTRTRMQSLIDQLREQWLGQRLPNVEFLQRATSRYKAQISLLDEMRLDRLGGAAVVIQARWRGLMARRHCALLAEQAVWPVKAWFEYTPTGRDSVHVAVQFFSNPAFNAYRYFFAHGSNDELYEDLDTMEKEVDDCVDKYLETQNLHQMRLSLQRQSASARASTKGTAQASGRRSTARGSVSEQVAGSSPQSRRTSKAVESRRTSKAVESRRASKAAEPDAQSPRHSVAAREPDLQPIVEAGSPATSHRQSHGQAGEDAASAAGSPAAPGTHRSVRSSRPITPAAGADAAVTVAAAPPGDGGDEASAAGEPSPSARSLAPAGPLGAEEAVEELGEGEAPAEERPATGEAASLQYY
mmetsp:Transcript_50768/g.147368  ORF Transcript_50768/g.147368 Transcript_50768/m.147368 type:complete len:918 (+) Transcript_50768:52-2805(+)